MDKNHTLSYKIKYSEEFNNNIEKFIVQNNKI